jgi:hypothetical protein
MAGPVGLHQRVCIVEGRLDWTSGAGLDVSSVESVGPEFAPIRRARSPHLPATEAYLQHTCCGFPLLRRAHCFRVLTLAFDRPLTDRFLLAVRSMS